MIEPTTFENNEKAFEYACKIHEWLDTSDGLRVALVADIGFNEEDQRSIFQLVVQAKSPIIGYAFGDASTQYFLKQNDLIGIKVIKIIKFKASFFKKYDVAICYINSLLEPTFDSHQGWTIRKHISPILNERPDDIWRIISG